jgi:hypothetical protein
VRSAPPQCRAVLASGRFVLTAQSACDCGRLAYLQEDAVGINGVLAGGAHAQQRARPPSSRPTVITHDVIDENQRYHLALAASFASQYNKTDQSFQAVLAQRARGKESEELKDATAYAKPKRQVYAKQSAAEQTEKSPPPPGWFSCWICVLALVVTSAR